MIKAKVDRSIILGLSRMNCEKLLKGEPIAFKGKEIGRPDIDNIIIMGGETEKDIHNELLQHLADNQPLEFEVH